MCREGGSSSTCHSKQEMKFSLVIFFSLSLFQHSLTSNLNFTIEMHLATAHKYHLKRTLSHSVVVLSDFFFIFTYGSNSFEKWMFEQVTTSWICYFTMSLKSLVKTNDVKLLKNGEVKEGELAMPITHAFFKPHYMLSLFWQYAKNSPLWRPLLNSLQFKLQYLISIRKGIF